MRFRLHLCLLLGILAFSAPTWAQSTASTAESILESIKQRDQLRSTSIFKDYPVRSVGPVIMSGRVSDIDVHPDDVNTFYVGYASGGLFKTTNKGLTMEPIFDHQGALGIGDIAISKANPDVIWVGTGENNSSRSSYAGVGIYKSSDAGQTWEHVGLVHSQHIGRIVTHPTDENIAWVASAGALYSNNDERGVFKTTDGGSTWSKTLFVNDSTSVIDLVIHPDEPEVLFAASWERDRKAWNFKEGGEGSAIWKSTDGGENWTRLTNGLPQGAHVGRIGIDIADSEPNVLYAVIDNQFETKTEVEVNEDRLSSTSFVDMSAEEFANLDEKALNHYLRANGFPEKYNAEVVKAAVANGDYKPNALAEYLGDANAALFQTDIEGAEIYRSNDGGESWEKVNSYKLERVFNTYGYYFGQVRVDPNDPDVVYTWGVPFIKSTDGGKTWTPKAEKPLKGNRQSVHVDHHAMWIDPDDSDHFLLGNDGGLYETFDGGDHFTHHNTASVGQFYAVSVDNEEPYNIYGGLQDNGTFFGSSQSVPAETAYWQRLFGGDGMHVYPDPRGNETIYVGFQYGNYFRLDRDESKSTKITPQHEIGEDRYRYNWNAPIAVSHHNPDIIYFGSQKLSRSLDRGESWTAISPDLTHNLPNGDVPYSTLTTIAESPINFNLIWTGSDDGKVQLTTNGGVTWEDVSAGLPEKLWVSEVHASKYDAGTAYVSLNGYRFDDFNTYLYKTTDFGKTWTSIKGNLPNEVTNVIMQDPVHPEILYAGLDHGTYISFDDGDEWHYLNQLPNVATYDIVAHTRDLDLILGTHGRSIYVMELEPLHKIADKTNEAIVAMEPAVVRRSNNWGRKQVEYRDRYMPSTSFMFYVGSEGNDQNVSITIKDENGKKVTDMKMKAHHGFNSLDWNLMIGGNEDEPKFIKKGNYTLEFKNGKSTDEVDFTVK